MLWLVSAVTELLLVGGVGTGLMLCSRRLFFLMDSSNISKKMEEKLL